MKGSRGNSSNRLVEKRSKKTLPRHPHPPGGEGRVSVGVTLKREVLCSTLEVQHISLMECMESCGAPMSTTGIPRRADRMGPMVVPQGLSLRTITSCRGRSVMFGYAN